ncbi:glutamine amidotransferase [Brevibacterium litoralis]|uniref:glutamine amidotransferase n=1 Tax=Brevibacterium litoralis TaxID=3138935 RepID=UPI0032EB2C4D
MCGIAALQVRNDALRPQLGTLLDGMLCEVIERGPDAAGVAVYDNPELNSAGVATLSLLGTDLGLEPTAIDTLLGEALPEGTAATVHELGSTTLVSAPIPVDLLATTLHQSYPALTITGRGEHVTVMKAVGNPRDVSTDHGLSTMTGSQAVSHTRMATESAVTATGSHPFAVSEDLCLVHNGSFSNHASVRRELKRLGVEFDSENDTEVGARFIAHRLQQGDTLESALEHLGETLDGFYTLVVTTADSMAVVRDPIACKPAIIAETDDYVAVASEFRALAHLPGIDDARLFEPEPGRVYTWKI